MARFQYQPKNHFYRTLILSLAVFLAVFGLFYAGLNSLSDNARRQQRKSLETAISNGIAYCYAMDGAYPESLAELEQRCGLIYDKDYFFVDYHITGANILPDVTIIEKGE